MANTYLTRTPSSTTNRKTFTISMWLKRSKLGATTGITLQGVNSGNDDFAIYFGSADDLQTFSWSGSSEQFTLTTNRKFRDVSAWYHIVVSVDTTQGTAADRVKLYINGVQETSFATANYPSQNADLEYNDTSALWVGRSYGGHYFEGAISHYHSIDGTAYDASAFGSTDATTGEWKINTSPSVTYGTNGFFILKDTNSGTDQSPNSNNLTVGGGTLTKTEDSPSNVFATLNAITPSSNNNRAGGTRHFNNSGTYDMRHSTLAVSKGKWYAEFYMADMTGGFTQVGIQDTTQFNDYSFMTNSSRGYGYLKDGTKRNASSISSYGDTFTSGDYIGVAVDLDNNKIYFSKNGVWQNSGDPTSGATGTGSAFDIADGYDYCIATSSNDAGTDQITDVNFGNGYFNVNAVSSAGTNASGNGIFEYDVPTGYTALSTKGLNL